MPRYSPQPWPDTIRAMRRRVSIRNRNDSTGGRLRRVKQYLDGEPFCFTYGDGVADVDIAAEIAFHKAHGKEATVTAVLPPGRYGALEISEGHVQRFTEKPPRTASRSTTTARSSDTRRGRSPSRSSRRPRVDRRWRRAITVCEFPTRCRTCHFELPRISPR